MNPDIKNEIVKALKSIPGEFPNGAKDPAWTQAVKREIRAIGKQNDFEVLPDDETRAIGWLYDLTWYKSWSDDSGHYGLEATPLILESEWLLDFENIRKDFEKLLIGKADYKVMVFQAKNSDIVREHMERLKLAIDKYQGSKAGETYILACLKWFGEKWEFEIELKTCL